MSAARFANYTSRSVSKIYMVGIITEPLKWTVCIRKRFGHIQQMEGKRNKGNTSMEDELNSDAK